MRLRHLHLPGLTHYTHASTLQDRLSRSLLAHKASLSPSTAPDPTILTAQFQPIYTTGRRDFEQLSAEQKDHLRAPFTPAYPTTSSAHGIQAKQQRAEFHAALRGGQTTYHGPGQLTAYAVLDLRRHGLSPRAYVHDVLEESVIRTCADFGVEGLRTENPGVWTRKYAKGGVEDEEKLCAVGVHLRRFVSSHGIGLNVGPEPIEWLGRVVACGLEGKGASCLEGVRGMTVEGGVEEVGKVFVRRFAECLGGVEGVDEIGEENVPE